MLKTLLALLILGPLTFSMAQEKPTEHIDPYMLACSTMNQKVPPTLAQARKMAPLIKEIVEPDQDYCWEDHSRCDLRTLVFKNFSLLLLHHKRAHQIQFLIAEFPNRRALEVVCGKDCVESSDHNKKTGGYAVDCQVYM